MSNEVELLKNYPSVSQLEQILDKYEHTSFPLISCLLDYTVPQIYASLSEGTKAKLRCKFQTLIGLGNLLGRVALPSADKVYFDLLQSCVDNQLFVNIIHNKKPLELREVDKLVFKGKLLAIVNEASILNGWDISNEFLRSSQSYSTYLSKGISDLYQRNLQPDIFVQSILSTDSSTQFFKVFFNLDNWKHFQETFFRLKEFQRKEYVRKLLLGYVVQIVNDNNIVPLCNILKFSNKYIDDNIIESVVLRSSKPLIQLIAVLKKDKETMLNQLHKWADPTHIKNEPITIQEARTFLLLQLVNSSSFDLTKNKTCLEGVSNHLQSFSENVRSLGMILADRICELSGENKIFKSVEVGYAELLTPSIQLQEMSYEDAWKALNESNLGLAALGPVERQNTSVEDTPMEDDSDNDSSLPPQVKVPDPIYIKDLISYITTDTKNPQAYDMRRVALLKGPTLLRQKSRHGNEVEFYSQDLLSNLIALDNFYSDADFDDLKLVNIVSVIVTNPSVTFYMFELLLTGDYSLQQRMFILSATSLAARELRGIKDSIITNSFTKQAFPTKQLPPELHDKYVGGAKYMDEIENELQDSLMHDASNEAQDQIIGKGKLVRVSRSLTRKEVQHSEKPIIPNFYKLIGTNFYFPLLNVWYESGSIDIGHYSPIFIAHYIKTLSLLLQVAYPSSTQLKDMIKEFLLLSCTIIRKVEELKIVESIITGVLLILELIDAEFLVLNFNNEIMLIYNWLTSTWEEIIDNKIKSLAAGLLLKLQEVSKKFERTLIDQDYGLY
ncbi:TEL2 [Candida theae]|uniref:TEL2 n=1 Tax=Candida theae TaxID=1198502 RepID=A0AAD5BDY5_9ASCO|nr:TEL2 [Candida theae]KAI5956008.1 TEL2 [Candida theae]